MRPHRKPGPAKWWEAKQSPVRLPVEHHAVYREAAESMGLSLNSYIVWQLAMAHGLEVPEALRAELAAGERAKDDPQAQLDLLNAS